MTVNDYFPVRKIGELEDGIGFILDAAGNITFCFEITAPEIFMLSPEKTMEIFKNYQLFLENPLVLGGTVLHQQDFYFAQDQKPEKTFLYAEEKWQDFFGNRPIFSHKRFIYLTYPHSAVFPEPHQEVKQSVKEVSEKMESYQAAALSLRNTFVSFMQQNKAIFDFKIESLSKAEISNLIFVAYLNRDFSVFKNLSRPIEEALPVFQFLRNEKCLMQKNSNINVVSIIEEGAETAYFRKTNIKEISDIEKEATQNPIFNKGRIFELSSSFPIGLGLPIPHIVNTKIIRLSSEQTKNIIKKETEKVETAVMFSSLFKQKGNGVLKNDALNAFEKHVQSEAKTPVYLQQNVITWHPNEQKQEKYVNEVCSAYSRMGVKFTLEDFETAPLFLQNAPGGSSWGKNRFLLTTADRAVSYLPMESHETGDKTGVSFLGSFGNDLKLDFRYSKHLSNYNMLVVGGSGKGKSVFTNHVLQYHINQRNICFLFDKGGSYEYLVHSNGGYYINTSKRENITFSPFLISQDEKGYYLFDVEEAPLERQQEVAYEKEKVMRVLEHIFAQSSKEKSEMTLAERNVFLRLLESFYTHINNTKIEKPSLTAFYVFCRQEVDRLKSENDQGNYLLSQNFKSFMMAMELFVGDNMFCKKGEYFYLLNGTEKRSLVGNNIIAIDLQAVSEKEVLYSLCMTLFLDAVQYTIEQLPSSVFKAVVIDEGIDMFVGGGKESKFIGTAARKIRKHGGGLTLIIQHLKIFETMPANVAGDLEENLAIKVVLGIDSDSEKSTHILSERLGMDDVDIAKIRSLDTSTDFGREYYIKMGRKGFLARLFLPEELLLMYSTTPELMQLKKNMYDFYEGNTEKIIEKLMFWQKKYHFENEKNRYKLMKEEFEKEKN